MFIITQTTHTKTHKPHTHNTLLQRKGIQFMWENRGYATFADFEADLKQSKRKAVRQVGVCCCFGGGKGVHFVSVCRRRRPRSNTQTPPTK